MFERFGISFLSNVSDKQKDRQTDNKQTDTNVIPGALKLYDWTMQDWTLTDDMARADIAGQPTKTVLPRRAW